MGAGLHGRLAGGCMRRALVVAFALATVPVLATPAAAAVITFDELVAGATSFGYDGDGDGVNDVVFSTTDPSGFNTVGPGPNMLYINEPGIEGTTLISPDLRVDFLVGAVNAVSFGFAVNTGAALPNAVTFSLFDAADNLLASVTADADFTLPNGVNPTRSPRPWCRWHSRARRLTAHSTSIRPPAVTSSTTSRALRHDRSAADPRALDPHTAWRRVGKGVRSAAAALALERTLAAQNRQW